MRMKAERWAEAVFVALQTYKNSSHVDEVGSFIGNW